MIGRLLQVGRRVSAALLVASCLGALSSTACAGDSTGSSERALTTREAALLAEVLVKNYRSAGAVFTVATLDRPGGSTVRLEGRLDWANHLGEATVAVDVGSAPSVVGWRRDVVLERWPDADEVLTGMGTAAAPVIARPPNMQRRLDQIIAVLVGLAGERPDNAQLVLQTEGSAFVREDELRGVPVVVMRYGSRNIYWLDAATGDMLRFEARSAEGDLPIVIDIFERGSETIELPDQSLWVSIDAVAEFYVRLSPSV